MNLKFIKILSLMLSIGMTFLVYLTYLSAYFNNNKITVYLNQYNEVYVEFIILPVLLFISIVGVWLILKEDLNFKFN